MAVGDWVPVRTIYKTGLNVSENVVSCAVICKSALSGLSKAVRMAIQERHSRAPIGQFDTGQVQGFDASVTLSSGDVICHQTVHPRCRARSQRLFVIKPYIRGIQGALDEGLLLKKDLRGGGSFCEVKHREFFKAVI